MNYCKIEAEQCKGCGLCVASCPNKCLIIQENINSLGYQYADFVGPNCTACGICYYVCPEPGAVTVVKEEKAAKEKVK